MLFLTVLDTYHMFSVVHKIIRLDDAWFGFATVSGEQVSSSELQPHCCTCHLRWVKEHSEVPTVSSLFV